MTPAPKRGWRFRFQPPPHSSRAARLDEDRAALEPPCGIYTERAARCFGGCALFDCYGAGVRATEAFADEHERNEAFVALYALHELLFLLSGALQLCGHAHPALRAQLTHTIAALDALAPASLAAVRALDIAAHEARAHALLRAVGDSLGGARARSHLQIRR